MQEFLSEMISKAESSSQRLLGQGLRPLQREVLQSLAERRSVFAGLPTGYGKSLCYWIPAEAWGWKVWVISPLVSLIEDQALAAEALGINAIAWGGSLSIHRRRQLEQKMMGGEWQICLLAPERLLSWVASGFLSLLSNAGLDADLIVLDEMHCLEEWRAFRSGYRDLFAPLRHATARGAVLLGLSASLAARESRAWTEELGGEHAFVGAGLGRDNLSLSVVPLEEEAERWLYLLEFLRDIPAPESALVYCSSRQEADEVARWLKSAGLAAVAYHAGLPLEERKERSRAFRAGRLRVVCATSAFGMGIDYPHVSRVIHFSMPHNLESYWQEVGRAGRAGQDAKGLTLWRRSEISRARLLRGSALDRYAELWRAWASGKCRKRVVADQLGMESEDCGRCDRCLSSVPISAQAWWVQDEASLMDWVRDKLQGEGGRATLGVTEG